MDFRDGTVLTTGAFTVSVAPFMILKLIPIGLMITLLRDLAEPAPV